MIIGPAIEPIRPLFEKRLRQDPQLTFFLLKETCKKITSLISRLQGESFQDTLSIVSEVLLALGSIDTEIRISHDQLAEMVGRNRVTVSKALLKLKKIGAIEQGNKMIKIKNPDFLKQISIENIDE